LILHSRVAEGASDGLGSRGKQLAGSVVRVYDLLLEASWKMCGETILPIDTRLMGMPQRSGRFEGRASHPMTWRSRRFFAAIRG